MQPHPEIFAAGAVSDEDGVVLVYGHGGRRRPADDVGAGHGRLVVNVDVEGPLIDFAHLQLAKVEPDQVREAAVDLEEPGQVGVHVHVGVRPHGPRRPVHVQWRGHPHRFRRVLDCHVVLGRVGHAERGPEDVRRVVVPGPPKPRVIARRQELPPHVEPEHGLQGGASHDHVFPGESHEGGPVAVVHVRRGENLDAVDEGEGTIVAVAGQRRREGQTENAIGGRREIELPDDVRLSQRLGSGVGAEVAQQGDAAAGDRDVEEALGGIEESVVGGGVEVEADVVVGLGRD